MGAQRAEKNKKGNAAKAKEKATELKVLATVAKNAQLKDPNSKILKLAAAQAAAKAKLADRQAKADAAKAKESSEKKTEEQKAANARKAKREEVAIKAKKG